MALTLKSLASVLRLILDGVESAASINTYQRASYAHARLLLDEEPVDDILLEDSEIASIAAAAGREAAQDAIRAARELELAQSPLDANDMPIIRGKANEVPAAPEEPVTEPETPVTETPVADTGDGKSETPQEP